jgi:hypothetical protein
MQWLRVRVRMRVGVWVRLWDEAGAEDGGVWLCRGWGCCVEEVVGEAGDLGVVVGVVEAAVLRRKIFYSLHREHQWYIYILWLFLFV